jgi:2-oxoglutarate ferredoxin oxidoreductase subunit beta
MVTTKDYALHRPTWCPGCGDFGILKAMQTACANLGLEPHEIVLVGGIGCSGKITDYFKAYGFHGVHGRILPLAMGIKLANRELTVIGAGGDGDGYSIGGNHFLHAIRRNVDITYIVFDNHVYGLTKGQSSPTANRGYKTKASPYGTAEEPMHPLGTALSCGVSFLAQGFSGDVKQLIRLIEEAIQHKGFSLLNVFTPCVTYNRVNTYEFYRENIVNLDEDPDYDPRDRGRALEVTMDFSRVYTGLIYIEEKPSYEERLPNFPEVPIVKLDVGGDDVDWRKVFLEEFA